MILEMWSEKCTVDNYVVFIHKKIEDTCKKGEVKQT